MIRCKCGERLFPTGAFYRGLLVNEIATTGSKIVQMREQIQVLRSKRYSKAFAAQGDRDRALLKQVEIELPALEGRFHGLRFLERELYSGKA